MSRASSAGCGAAAAARCARQPSRYGNAAGRRSTSRRTEAMTCTPIFSSSSRSVATCARAQAVPRAAEPQFLQQHVGRGGEQHAQLVGEEPRATGAIEGDVEQLLDAVLDLAALAVDALVDALRLARQVGDHEARVERAARGPRAGRPRPCRPRDARGSRCRRRRRSRCRRARSGRWLR